MTQAPTLVIVGVTGDLAARKLLPALRALAAGGALPFGRIVGTSRRLVAATDIVPADDMLAPLFEVAELPEDPRAYTALAQRLADGGDAYFYLAVPAGTAGAVAARLAGAGCRGTVVLEKPFGTDEVSAAQEAARVREAFGGNVLRVDHYLAKPLAARLAHSAPARGAAHTHVVAAEALGREGRASYYDSAGALRDMGNHLLSLLCAAFGAHTAAERMAEMRQLGVVRAARAQYAGYAEEAGQATDTETFFSIELSHAAHPGATFVLASGKALEAKATFVRTDKATYAEESGDQDAYVRVFAALPHGSDDVFLSEAEALESWRLLDAARLAWGELSTYQKGSSVDALLG